MMQVETPDAAGPRAAVHPDVDHIKAYYDSRFNIGRGQYMTGVSAASNLKSGAQNRLMLERIQKGLGGKLEPRHITRLVQSIMAGQNRKKNLQALLYCVSTQLYLLQDALQNNNEAQYKNVATLLNPLIPKIDQGKKLAVDESNLYLSVREVFGIPQEGFSWEKKTPLQYADPRMGSVSVVGDNLRMHCISPYQLVAASFLLLSAGGEETINIEFHAKSLDWTKDPMGDEHVPMTPKIIAKYLEHLLGMLNNSDKKITISQRFFTTKPLGFAELKEIIEKCKNAHDNSSIAQVCALKTVPEPTSAPTLVR